MLKWVGNWSWEAEYVSCVGLLECVCVCYDEGSTGDDPKKWFLSRLDELYRCEKFERGFEAESERAC